MGIISMNGTDRVGNQNRVEQLALLRALVSFLGEKDQFGWWDCSFLGATGQKFLAITQPRSYVAAAVLAASEAARRVHDARIGKGGVFHLFRLPQVIEQKLHRQILTGEPKAFAASLDNREKALHALKSLAKDSASTPEGPVKLGDARSLSSASIVGKLAGIYLGAFKASKQTMPYFTATE
jgi:hypothetical protein